MKLLGLDVGQKRIGVAVAEDNIVSTYNIIDAENLENAIVEVSQCRVNSFLYVIPYCPCIYQAAP